MNIICFPYERVVQINVHILETEPGMKGAIDLGKLQGALSRIDNAILYQGLDDIFEIASKYAFSIAHAHALPDANKRTALAVALEYLSLNDFEIKEDNDLFAEAMVDCVLNVIDEQDFADLLYAQWSSEQALL